MSKKGDGIPEEGNEPDVIAARNQLLPAGEREENIPCDLNDTTWFEKIDGSEGAVLP